MVKRAVGLILLGGVLFIVAPANRVPLLKTSPAASPTPAPIPKVDEKKPNALQRFFSWVGDTVTRPFRKQVPVISDPPHVVVTPSKSLISFCRPDLRQITEQGCSPGREVELTATVGSPENDAKVLFTWNVTAGRLKGEGPKVTWDLSELAIGTYTAMVEVNDGNQLTANAATSVTIAQCSDCMTVVIPCPTVSVSCPSGADSKLPIPFAATISGGDSDVKPTYTWSITAGKIISGQGTSKITIDASKLAGQAVTATVTVGGDYSPRCQRKIASCSVLEVQ